MRAHLVFLITLMLIFTSGCDFKKGKDKSKISGAEKSSKGVAAFREKLKKEGFGNKQKNMKKLGESLDNRS
jgi:hypothetical protein